MQAVRATHHRNEDRIIRTEYTSYTGPTCAGGPQIGLGLYPYRSIDKGIPGGTWAPSHGTGQDGEFLAGVGWPVPRFTDKGDGTSLLTSRVGSMGTNSAFLRFTTAGSLDLTFGSPPTGVVVMNVGLYDNEARTDWVKCTEHTIPAANRIKFVAMPFIITGHQRSGTTLLSRLCSVHPDLGMTNEFGNFLCVGEKYPNYQRRLLKRWGGIVTRRWPMAESFEGRGPHRFVMRQNNQLVWRYLKILKGQQTDLVTAKVIDQAMRHLFPSARVVGDKYPEYIFDLDRLVADEDLQCLVIYRDCRDVTSSTLQRARNQWRRMPFFVRRVNTAEKVAHRWVRAIELMEKHQDRLFVMRYEDLVREVTRPLADLSRWLGIDPEGFQATEISARSIGKYRRGLTQEELATVLEIAGPTMSRLGYV